MLRDGTAIEVSSFKVTGSFVMLTLPDGRQVAYDLADVDPASLAPPEAPTAPVGAATAAPTLGGLASGLALEERQGESTIRITDQDVEHIRPARSAAAEGTPAAEERGVPEGFTEGGGISLNNVEMVALEEGQWRVSGEVVNRTPQVARSVRMKLEVGGKSPVTIDFDVTSTLPPDERAVFEHVFRAEVEEGQSQPPARFRVLWMQDETRRQPAAPTFGGGPPVPDVVSRQEPVLD